EYAEIPRPLVVVEDHLLIEVGEVRHGYGRTGVHLPFSLFLPFSTRTASEPVSAHAPARPDPRACCTSRARPAPCQGCRSGPSAAARNDGPFESPLPRGRRSCRCRA